MATEKIPLVSVIIPMFNAAKFIPQTLESLLFQTMKDFEVIVVDDCSTDNSVEVVENFMDSFAAEGIPLYLIELQKNSGSPGFPRNIGIQFSHGKYISFLDSDDLFTQTALEELSTLAEESQADVVHTDTFFMLLEDDRIEVCKRQTLPVVSAPILETADIAQRVLYWVNRGYNWESVTMFCRRNFLVGNQIYFPLLLNNEDMVFSFAILCTAEKILRVPNITYFYRQRFDSVSQKQMDAEKTFHKWLRVLNNGLNEFAKVMASQKFFADKPDFRYVVLNFFFREILYVFTSFYVGNPPFTFDEFIKKEFHAEDAELVTQLFNTVHIQQLRIARLSKELEKFQKQ